MKNWFLLFPLACAFGCGGSDLEIYDIQGTVNFDGKPLPFGRIEFIPDTTKQNTGPAGFAVVVDGKYDTTENGRGAIAGAHVVRLTGYASEPADIPEDAPDPESVESNVEPLFYAYSMDRDLPEEPSTQEFVIPAIAAGFDGSKSQVATGSVGDP